MFSLKHVEIGATFHFIGIGGIGMSGIAQIIIALGYKVSGSDVTKNYNTDKLEALGAKIFYGHQSENVINSDYIVLSTAISDSNPEVAMARSLGIPMIKRAELLAALMEDKKGINISGTHGKTTTTSIIASIFDEAALQPTVVNGGIINSKATNAYFGDGEYFIAEADESDKSFLILPSFISVITNIDPEHLEYYDYNFVNQVNCYKQFVGQVHPDGVAILCADHPVVLELVQQVQKTNIITYGIENEASDIRAQNIRLNPDHSLFDVYIHVDKQKQIILKDVILGVPGRQNILNSLSAIAVAYKCDIDFDKIILGLQNFRGVKRRFTIVGEYNGAKIIDDYAHHPVEISATIDTARIAVNNDARVIAVCQPHRYSRLSNLFDDFANCFKNADTVYVMDIYSAGEQPIEGITSEALVSKMKQNRMHADVSFVASNHDLIDHLKQKLRCGDILLMMGAGNISSFAVSLPQILVGMI